LAYVAEVPVNWCPRWGRCWPTKKSSMARARWGDSMSSASRCGNGCCRLPPMPIVARRPEAGRMAREPRLRCKRIGSAAPSARRSIYAADRRQDSSVHYQAGYAVRRHLMVLARNTAVDVVTTEGRNPRSGSIGRRRREKRSAAARTRQGQDRGLTGGYAVNPVNGRTAADLDCDYVLMSYGTGHYGCPSA